VLFIELFGDENVASIQGAIVWICFHGLFGEVVEVRVLNGYMWSGANCMMENLSFDTKKLDSGFGFLGSRCWCQLRCFSFVSACLIFYLGLLRFSEIFVRHLSSHSLL
jgi:hypothetical protein